jgi:serine phosphatase RsbU (regulator of sigma subunit)
MVMATHAKLHGRITQRVGFHVALAVNLTMVIGVAGFLIFDFVRESRQRLQDKVLGLQEQAVTIHQGLVRLRGAPPQQLQEYIDAVCGRIGDAEAPGHHIIAEIDGSILQADAHNRASDEMYAAMASAASDPRSHGSYHGKQFVVGSYKEDGVTVSLAEESAKVHEAIRAQVLVRSVGMAPFGIVLAGAVNFAIRKVVTKPLRRLVRTIDEIGTGGVGAEAGRFRSAELRYLAEAVNGMSRSLAQAQGRLKRALIKARRIQQNLLPPAGEVAGLCLAARYQPAEDVAGDYYDILPTANGNTLLCVLDVVGHGVPAAMTAAMLKILLLQAADHSSPPGEMLRWLNQRFMAVSLREDFASVFLAKWDACSRTLSYASAGHESALLASGCSPAMRLDSPGTLIGMMADATWDTAALAVQPGDLLLCLTDGVIEARNSAGALFGRERLARVFEQHRASPPALLLEAIDQAVLEHLKGAQISDDFTLVAVKFS